MHSSPQPKLAILIPNFRAGGVQQTMLILAGGLAECGCQVDLLVCEPVGELSASVPNGVRVVETKAGTRPAAAWHLLRRVPTMAPALIACMTGTRRLNPIPAIARYLRTSRPDAILGADDVMNFLAIAAAASDRPPVRCVISVHRHLSSKYPGPAMPWKARLIRPLYKRADAVVAVSQGVADDLPGFAKVPAQRVTTIYNPVVSPQLQTAAEAAADHPWLREPGGTPVILGVGKLSPRKDFATLLRAFARVRNAVDVRLIVVGEGIERPSLLALAGELGVADHFDLPGYLPNPCALMARAAVFVSAARSEGLGNVIIEALACGCPVVSTDCPSGPAEILSHGEFGALIAPGDSGAMADAILATLAKPPPRDRLKRRADDFSVSRAVERYRRLLLPSQGTR